LVPAAEANGPADELVCARLAIRGAVQGVGFRPCVFRLATELGLLGWVNNSAEGVFIELEGRCAQVQRFILRIEIEKPLRSFIQSLETSWLEPAGYSRFEIRASDSRGPKTALILPDIAIMTIISPKSHLISTRASQKNVSPTAYFCSLMISTMASSSYD
jgi:acylphosphatase